MIQQPQTKIGSIGKEFIREICNAGGENNKSLLSGRNDYLNNLLNIGSKLWTSDPSKNGGIVYNRDLSNKIIQWYEYYCNIAQIDVNFLIAQTFEESSFRVWVFSESDDMGLTQFSIPTFYDYGIKNNDSEFSKINITNDDREKLTNNVDNSIAYLEITYKNWENFRVVGETIFQNIIDNPEILVKMQVKYMETISNQYNKLASNVLFGYNRGPGYIKSTYFQTVKDDERKNGSEKADGGVKYVHKVFRRLYDSFGYSWLNMDAPTSEFDGTQANFDKAK